MSNDETLSTSARDRLADSRSPDALMPDERERLLARLELAARRKLLRMEERLDALGDAAIAIDPGNEAFDGPALRQDQEAGLAGDFADDLDRRASGVGDTVVIVAAIGRDLLDEQEEAARDLQQPSAAVTVLDISGMGFDKR